MSATPGTPAIAPPHRLPPRVAGWMLGGAGALIALCVWALLSQVLAGGGGVINRLPGPLIVAREFAHYVTGDLVRDLASSLRVFLIGWLGGVALATVAGLLLGRVGVLGNIFLPIVEAMRPVSSIAWVPLSIVWFGFGLTSKIFLVGLAVFLVVIVYAVDGSRRVPDDLARTATMLGMNGWQRFRSLILPGTLAEVLIVAELVAADSGLGAHLISVEQSYDVPAVMAAMVAFGLTGFAMNAAFSWVERRLMPWRHERGAHER
jgi:ABC-type nitrate/sulfonate/bicarbonate transport system permease component